MTQETTTSISMDNLDFFWAADCQTNFREPTLGEVGSRLGARLFADLEGHEPPQKKPRQDHRCQGCDFCKFVDVLSVKLGFSRLLTWHYMIHGYVFLLVVSVVICWQTQHPTHGVAPTHLRDMSCEVHVGTPFDVWNPCRIPGIFPRYSPGRFLYSVVSVSS